MAAAGGAYSRFVALAKVVLPIAALALLAMLFLIAERIDPDQAIPFAEIDVTQFAREARVGAPRFAGVTEDGTVVALSADVARPDPAAPARINAEGLEAEFSSPDGSTVVARAATGAVDSAERRIELGGGVELSTSTGYRISTGGLHAALAVTELRSDGGVEAIGPPGKISAGAMSVTQNPADPAAYLLVFNGGVKLVYEPAE